MQDVLSKNMFLVLELYNVVNWLSPTLRYLTSFVVTGVMARHVAEEGATVTVSLLSQIP